ncbi:MAG: ubiquinone/menaquinone biosynthesis C-methylase UbiE [Myxococcota bacterium]|jgi:ubiquinone/menaquinone biosynthesis C-methylase UbiE
MSADPTFWNNVAEKYAASPVDNPDAFDRKTEITLSHLTPESTVLDVGCGTGSFALRLAPHVRAVHGLDLSSEMVRIAKGKAADAANVTFHTGPFDASFTAIEDGTLDMLCAYSLLHLVEDRAATLAQMYRLLKPGGIFVSSTACLAEGWMPYKLIIPVMQFIGKAPFVSIIRTSTVMEDIQKAGFTDAERLDVGAAAQTTFIVAHKAT